MRAALWTATALGIAIAWIGCGASRSSHAREVSQAPPAAPGPPYQTPEARPALPEQRPLTPAETRPTTAPPGPAPRPERGPPPPPGQPVPASPLTAHLPPPRGDAKPTQAPRDGLEWGTHREGFDYAQFRVIEDPAACQRACASDPSCAAFTYVKPGVRDPYALCQLKHAVPKPKFDDCCISGVGPGR